MLTVFEHFVQDGKIDKVKLRHNMNNILHVDYGYGASITCPISYEWIGFPREKGRRHHHSSNSGRKLNMKVLLHLQAEPVWSKPEKVALWKATSSFRSLEMNLIYILKQNSTNSGNKTTESVLNLQADLSPWLSDMLNFVGAWSPPGSDLVKVT